MIAAAKFHSYPSKFNSSSTLAMKRSNDELGGSGSTSEQQNKRMNIMGGGVAAAPAGGGGGFDEERFLEEQQQRLLLASAAPGGGGNNAFDDAGLASLLSPHLGNLYAASPGQLYPQQQPTTTNAHAGSVQMLLDEINRTQQQEAAASNLLAQARMNTASAAAAADSMFYHQQQLAGWPNMAAAAAAAAAAARMPGAYSSNMNLPDSVVGQAAAAEGMMDPLTMATIAQMNRYAGGGGGVGGDDTASLLLQQQLRSASVPQQDPYMTLLLQSMAASSSTGGGSSSFPSAAAALMGGGGGGYLPSGDLLQQQASMYLANSGNVGHSSLDAAQQLRGAPQQAVAAASSSRSASARTADGGVPLSLPSDDNNLSEYQCLLRAQIDLFAATPVDIDGNAQGRNKPIVLGQVGIRCRHCHANPSTSRRARGAVYFPAKLSGLYQAAQNMA
jgi:hypothetical protein